MGKVAFVVGGEFEDTEYRVPYDRIKTAGHEIVIVGVKKGEQLRGKNGRETVRVQATPAEVSADEFDALVIPGGHSPDKLRMDRGIVDFVSDFGRADKPVAAICHGGSLLIEADLVEGKRITSWPSIRTDLVNAGAHWVDEEVCVDGNLISSRRPADAEAFSRTILERVGTLEPA